MIKYSFLEGHLYLTKFILPLHVRLYRTQANALLHKPLTRLHRLPLRSFESAHLCSCCEKENYQTLEENITIICRTARIGSAYLVLVYYG